MTTLHVRGSHFKLSCGHWNLWSINLKHGTIEIWNMAGSWNITKIKLTFTIPFHNYTGSINFNKSLNEFLYEWNSFKWVNLANAPLLPPPPPPWKHLETVFWCFQGGLNSRKLQNCLEIGIHSSPTLTEYFLSKRNWDQLFSLYWR